jgi:peptidoglycan hydrolase-like protein with peptidoglycan-binding domain
MKKLLAVLAVYFLVPSCAFAQVQNEDCIVLTHDMQQGVSDSSTGGEVSMLQGFLSDRGLINKVNGNFGPQTKAAVTNFQRLVGVKTTTATAGRVGPATRAAIQNATCSPVSESDTSSGSTSNPTPTNINRTTSIEVAGRPSLSLSYSGGKEALLTGKGKLRVRTGPTAIQTNPYYIARSIPIFKSDASNPVEANSNTYLVTSDSFNVTDLFQVLTLQPNKNYTFDITETAKVSELFAGSYVAKPYQFVRMTADSNGYNSYYTDLPIGGSQSSNTVTIIGETSPYLSNVSSDSTGQITIVGDRLHLADNVVTVDGVSIGYPIFKAQPGYITFNASAFNIATGVHTIQVTNTKVGNSNRYAVTVGTESSSQAPTIELLSGPDLRLTYSSGKESTLIGTAKVKLSTGSMPINVYYTQLAQAILFSKGGQYVYTNSNRPEVSCQGLNLSTSLNTLPANTSYTCDITNTAKTSELFAGSYSMTPSTVFYTNSSTSDGYIKILNSASSNSVTIVGETSPYIDSAQVSGANLLIFGTRLGTNLTVSVNGVSVTASVSPSDSKQMVSVSLTSLGVTAPGSYAVTVSNSNGLSNRAGFTVDSLTTGPAISITQSATTTKVGESWTVSWSGQNVTGCVLNQSIGNGSWVQMASGVSGSQSFTGAVANTYNYSASCTYGSGGNKSSTIITHTTTYGDVSPTTTTVSLSASSPVSQSVVGGSTFGIATYSIRLGTSGSSATIREMRFTTSAVDAIDTVTVGGITAPVVANRATITGLAIPVSSTGTDIPVTVHFSGFQNSTTGGSLTSSIPNVTLSLAYLQETVGSTVVTPTFSPVSSNRFALVGSKPTVTVPTEGGALMLGVESKIGEFSIRADPNGKVALAAFGIRTAGVGITNPSFSGFRLSDGATTIPSSIVSNGDSSVTFTLNTPYEVSAGQAKTFSVYAVVNGTPQSSVTPYTASYLVAERFAWKDVIGGGTTFGGSDIYLFPSNSYRTSGSGSPVVQSVSLTVSAAGSSSAFKIGDPMTISWSMNQNVTNNSTLWLNLMPASGGSGGGLIAVKLPGTFAQNGQHAWTIPSSIFQGDVGVPLPPGTYKVKAFLYQGNVGCLGFCAQGTNQSPTILASDESDTQFTIACPTGTTWSGFNCTTSSAAAPAITSITPSSGTTGTSIVISGTGFTNNNTVRFYPTSNPNSFTSEQFNTVATECNTGSSNGCSKITLNVPSNFTNTNWNSAITPGTYTVSVKNANGVSNTTSFTVTALAPQLIAPSISSLSPSSASSGARVTINGAGFTTISNQVLMDYAATGDRWYTLVSSDTSSGTSLTFDVPTNMPCPTYKSGGVGCPAPYAIPAGSHTITVKNANGTSNTVPFTVTSSQTTTPPGSNAMSCSAPRTTGQAQGATACYGVWDYGSAFGNDKDMCNDYASGTGCTVSTTACSSGVAVASRYVTISSASASDLSTIASNLGVSVDVLKANMVAVWIYGCATPTSVTAIPTATASLVSNTPQTLSPGQTNVTFATVRLTAGPVAVNNLNGIQISSDSSYVSNLTNFRVFDGNTQLGSSLSGLSWGGDYWQNWVTVSGVSIPANTYKTFTIKADVKPQAPSGTVRVGVVGWNFNSPGAEMDTKGAAFYGSTMTVTASTPATPTTGLYQVYANGSLATYSNGLTKDQALSGCNAYMANVGQKVSVKCVWNGETIVDYAAPAVQTLTPTSTATKAFAYGVYEGTYSSSAARLSHGEGTISITLPSSVTGNVLVLTSYEPVNWVITNGSQVVPSQVIAVGYYDQRVTGLSGVPTEYHSVKSDGVYQFAYNTTDPEFTKLVNWLKDKGIDLKASNFKGSYTGSTFSYNGTNSLVLGDATACTDLPVNMFRGFEIPAVTSLQSFLQSKGLISEVSGFYGDKTVAAVKLYQGSKGLPETGMVYDFTRAAIKADSCQ